MKNKNVFLNSLKKDILCLKKKLDNKFNVIVIVLGGIFFVVSILFLLLKIKSCICSKKNDCDDVLDDDFYEDYYALDYEEE